MKVNNDYKYLKYNDFWQNSLQRLEDIAKTLERNFYKLEKKYYDFNSIYDNITTEINTLTSIYSSLNNLQGREYLLKLKAVFEDYRKRYTGNGIDFKIIYFLNSKINELREQSFNKFPKLEHSFIIYQDLVSKDDTETDRNIQKYNELKRSAQYKWITYFRNGSWFITPCNNFQIIKPVQAEILKKNESNIILKSDNKLLEVIDIFSRFSNNEQIRFFLIVKYNEEIKSFAAERLGKIIMSDKNFIIPGLKAIKKSKISSGRFRIFGKNHIYL